ncbi:LAME_0D06282g1_1 [Lachancea meyersii CBS 8951]|uniref:lysine--tRNA ligase n=1 Tax=Lachancea meyersii CBS 8951 TaxID=1266667 RepID=A0A1G4J9K0_9SACH|nr:LAME_0D06282g1_1 [Lachancea meyersii CBS 8951]
MLRWSLASRLRGSFRLVQTQAVDFTARNETISQNLNHFYPSLSELTTVTTSISHFKNKYAALENDDTSEREVLRARINSIRSAGKNMCFIDVAHAQSSMQLILNYNLMTKHISDKSSVTKEDFFQHVQSLKPGDHIQACGFPGFSQRERTLSLKCTQLIRILAPALQALPPKLSDPVKRNQNRVLDYQVNGHDSLIVRHKILSAIREFLNTRTFVEVETPILSSKANGAAAEPFTTRAKSTGKTFELRVAPELWLKRLIVGGLDHVYEIGKVFRNEGVDATHNPEFTTLEFYQSYASMEDLIALSEELYLHVLSSVDSAIAKDLKEPFLANGAKFNRVEFLPFLQKETNVDLSEVDLTSSSEITAAFASKGINLDTDGKSPQQILNFLCGRYIEDKYCKGIVPTLIYHHPTVMSPLAKGNPEDSMLTSKRFEVFIGGKEYINAYEEENCPALQLQKFIAQQEAHDNYGDNESLAVDNSYVEAMKWGMPPIGGFGLGVDRLCMLLTGNTRIERVLSFGTIDDISRQ